MSGLLWGLLLLPAAVGLVLVVLGPRVERFAPVAGLLTAAGTLGLALGSGTSLRASAPFLLGQPFDLGMDGLSRTLAVTVSAVTVCVLAAVPSQVDARRGRLCGWLLLFLASVLLTLSARSLLPLLVGWELMGAASYLLIAHEVRDRRAAGSATTALLTTRALDLGLYLAAGAAIAGSGTLVLEALPSLPSGWRDAAALGVVAAGFGKAAQLPATYWLSRAMDGPSPVSALLHSAAMVAMGGYLLLRTAPLLHATGWADDVVAWTGAFTAVLLGVVALAQRDLKQLLAASTASQLGFVVLAAGLGAREAGAAHLVGHAAVKSLLFLTAGLWLHVLHTKDLGQLRGAVLRSPAVGALAVVGLLSLGGVAPFALWGTKDVVLAAALEQSLPLYLAGLLAAALSAAYAGRALGMVLRPQAAGPALSLRPPGRVEVPVTSWAPLVPLAAGAVLLALVVLGPVGRAFGQLVGREPLGAEPVELLLSGLLSVAVLTAVAVHSDSVSSRLPRAALRWWDLEAAVHTLAVGPVLHLSRALAVFDDAVLDRTVMASAAGVRRLAVSAGRADDRLLDGAVEQAATITVRTATLSARQDDQGIDGAVRLVGRLVQTAGRFAPRPQTGQLHQYYAQAAALLVAATVLLLLVEG